MHETPDQSVLFATGTPAGCPILAIDGAAAQDEVANAGANMEDFLPNEDLPKTDGFHIWEGKIEISRSQMDGEIDVEWKGTVRPATDEDFARFEFPTPAGPRTADLEAAILAIVTEQADDLCWLDVYLKLGKLVGVEFNPQLLPAEQFLANCRRFHESLASGLPYTPDPGPNSSLEQLRAVAEAYERWEADMLLDNEAWHGGLASLPTLTYPLWDRLLEIQRLRNRALGRR